MQPVFLRRIFPRLAPACMMVFSAASVQALDMSVDAADLTRGAALYDAHCATCHGAQLEGQPDWRSPGPDGRLPAPPHDETGHTWHHGDRLLFDYVRLGGAGALAARGVSGFDRAMPAFGHLLAASEIRDIMAFVKSTWPEPIRAYQAQATENEAPR